MTRFGRIRKDQSERGASAVEFAIVLPVLILLIFGIIEFGLYFRESLTIASAAASAARTGATMGTRDEADNAILQALEAGLYNQVDSSVLISVEIYEARPVDGVPTGPSDFYTFVPSNVTIFLGLNSANTSGPDVSTTILTSPLDTVRDNGRSIRSE